MNTTEIIAVIGLLVAVTNVIVEVLKHVTWDKIPTNLLVLIVAMVLTLGAGIAYLQIKAIPMAWFMVAALVIMGFFVAYAAMFGFDKFKEIMQWDKLNR